LAGCVGRFPRVVRVDIRRKSPGAKQRFDELPALNGELPEYGDERRRDNPRDVT
jgi:hypothetical protein